MEGTGVPIPRPAGTHAGLAHFTWVFYLLVAYLAWTLPYFAVKYWPVLTRWGHGVRG